jgi:hypothetical protein
MDHAQYAGGVVRRWMYGDFFRHFLEERSDAILGELLRLSGGNVEPTQTFAWQTQIDALKKLSLPAAQQATAKIYF